MPYYMIYKQVQRLYSHRKSIAALNKTSGFWHLQHATEIVEAVFMLLFRPHRHPAYGSTHLISNSAQTPGTDAGLGINVPQALQAKSAKTPVTERALS